MKNRILQIISWYIAFVGLAGGWVIFLMWVGGRYLNAESFISLEFIGFIWTLAFFWLLLVAIIMLFLYVGLNRRSLNLKMLYTGILILLNVLSVFTILSIHADIEKDVFVKITNESGREVVDMELYGEFDKLQIGDLRDGSSKVINYEPHYLNAEGRHYQKPDSLKLIISYEGNVDTIGFPTFKMGYCRQLVLDKKLKLKST